MQSLMQKHRRVLKSKDFASIRSFGDSWSNKSFVLLARKRDNRYAESPSRFGFIVSKKIGNAVIRNRFKRQMRNSANGLVVKPGHDIVFIARNRIHECDYQDIRRFMGKLVSVANLQVE